MRMARNTQSNSSPGFVLTVVFTFQFYFSNMPVWERESFFRCVRISWAELQLSSYICANYRRVQFVTFFSWATLKILATHQLNFIHRQANSSLKSTNLLYYFFHFFKNILKYSTLKINSLHDESKETEY